MSFHRESTALASVLESKRAIRSASFQLLFRANGIPAVRSYLLTNLLPLTPEEDNGDTSRSN
jgi:hypothetical protein